MLTKCFKCRKGSGDDSAHHPAPPSRSDTPSCSPTTLSAPALRPPRSHNPSSAPTPSPTLSPSPRFGTPPSSPSPPQLGGADGAAALDVLVAELVQNNHFLCGRLVDAERKHGLAEATIAELRGKLARAGLTFGRGRALPAPTVKSAPTGGTARKPADATRTDITELHGSVGGAPPPAFGASHSRPQVIGGAPSPRV